MFWWTKEIKFYGTESFDFGACGANSDINDVIIFALDKLWTLKINVITL